MSIVSARMLSLSITGREKELVMKHRDEIAASLAPGVERQAMNAVDLQEGQADQAVAGKHELEVWELEVAGFEGPLAGRLYRAAIDGRRDLLIVFFHGGGFV